MRIPSRACLLGQRPAVEARQHEVDDDDVGSLEAELLERPLAVLDPLDVVSGMPEVSAHRARDHAVVLDEQYACHMQAG